MTRKIRKTGQCRTTLGRSARLPRALGEGGPAAHRVLLRPHRRCAVARMTFPVHCASSWAMRSPSHRSPPSRGSRPRGAPLGRLAASGSPGRRTQLAGVQRPEEDAMVPRIDGLLELGELLGLGGDGRSRPRASSAAVPSGPLLNSQTGRWPGRRGCAARIRGLLQPVRVVHAAADDEGVIARQVAHGLRRARLRCPVRPPPASRRCARRSPGWSRTCWHTRRVSTSFTLAVRTWQARLARAGRRARLSHGD